MDKHNNIDQDMDNIDEQDSVISDGEVSNGNENEIELQEQYEQEWYENVQNDSELETVKEQLEEQSKLCEDYLNRLQRATAEFENYKKRTTKEKQMIYSDALCDIVSVFLPVIDSIDRAIQICGSEDDNKPVREGIELVKRQINEAINNLEIEAIECEGENFDPELHNAVMHIEDQEYGSNIVVEEFQKGYKIKDKVIRHSMVKVVN